MKRPTHKMRGTPTHNSWCALKQRCNYPKHIQYHAYGGRGIRVCERWSLFENFLKDMGIRPNGMTIERVDTNGDYSPENCIWATIKEQQRNRRSTIKVEMDGKTQCVKDWCDELGIIPDRVYALIRHRKISPLEAIKCAR